MNKIRERKAYYDLLRVIAILCVIYNHTNKRGYYLYAFEATWILKVIYMANAALIAVAVPIFFMISGALLLPKKEDIATIYKKRVSRMVAVLILFSIIKVCCDYILQGNRIGIQDFILKLVTDGITPAYWYLYAYIAYLICLPFTRRLAEHMSDNEYKYLFAILLIVEGVIPTIQLFTGIDEINGFFVIPLLHNIIVYPLLGYYLAERVPREHYKKSGIKYALIVMIIILGFFVGTTIYRNVPYSEFTTYDKGLFNCSFTALLDVSVYYIVRTFFENAHPSDRCIRIIQSMGQLVFGIYLIEPIVRENTLMVYDYMSALLPKYLAAWFWVFIIFVICSVIVCFLKKLPLFRKLL